MADNDKTAPSITTPAEPGTQPGGDALLARLERMETLLAKQAAGAARGRALNAILMLALVLVLVFGLYWMNATVAGTVRELPALISTTTHTVEQLGGAIEDISSVDFEALNTTIGEIGQSMEALNMEALNSSIEDLQVVVEGLSNVMQFFG